jgi:hypothetical protein
MKLVVELLLAMSVEGRVLGDDTDGAVAVVDGAEGARLGGGVAGAVAVVEGVKPGDGLDGAAADVEGDEDELEELAAGQGWPLACRTWPGRHSEGVLAEGWVVDGDAAGAAVVGLLCANADPPASNAVQAAANRRCFMKCLRGLANRMKC